MAGFMALHCLVNLDYRQTGRAILVGSSWYSIKTDCIRSFWAHETQAVLISLSVPVPVQFSPLISGMHNGQCGQCCSLAWENARTWAEGLFGQLQRHLAQCKQAYEMNIAPEPISVASAQPFPAMI